MRKLFRGTNNIGMDWTSMPSATTYAHPRLRAGGNFAGLAKDVPPYRFDEKTTL